MTTRQDPVVGEFDHRRDSFVPEAAFLAKSTPLITPFDQPFSPNQSPADNSLHAVTRTGEAGASSSETKGSNHPSSKRRTRGRAISHRAGRDGPGEDSRNRWLVSYADFVTLLLGLFVVMYAISSINEEKYQKLSKTFAGIFENSTLTMDPLQVGEPVTTVTSEIVDAATDVPRDHSANERSSALLTSRAHVASALGGIAQDMGLNVASNERWMEISLDAQISFDPDSARLKPAAVAYLRDLVDWLGTFDNPITVEGFTDNVPVSSGQFVSNWQLSAARASAVAESLTVAGIDAERISAVGYGENHPVATNASPEGRAKNRRVVIVVAHDAKDSRNLNANPETSAFAFVKHGEDGALELPGRRTAQGGLLFSNEGRSD